MLKLSHCVLGVGVLAYGACSADGRGPTNPSQAGSDGDAGSTSVAGRSGGGSASGSGSTAGKDSGGQTTGGAGVAGMPHGAGGSAGSSGGGAGGSASDERPNVVVVLLDDMGYSDLSPYGGEIRTPNIEQLAETGTRFRNFHVTPRCSPTRMSLLTGLYTQQVATAPGESLPPLRTDNNVTLPEMLSAAGYHTYMAGKWHLGDAEPQWPTNRGFDYVFGLGPNGAGAGSNKWNKDLYFFHGKDDAIAEREYPATAGAFYQTSAIGDYAVDYLDHHAEQQDDEPFFMYLAFNAPHFPLQAPRTLVEDAPQAGGKSYLEMYADGWTAWRNRRFENMLNEGVIDATYGLSPPEEFMDGQSIPLWSTLTAPRQADLTRKMALHAAMIESVDTAIGRVVARLKALGELENTLIFVMSDNGGNYESGVFGQHDPAGAAGPTPSPATGQDLANLGTADAPNDQVFVGGGWANVQNTPFRFFKHYTHGGGVRSPLVVSWPANTKAPGAWTNQVAHVIDLTPTILEATGVTQPATHDGHAVLGVEGTSLVTTIASGTDPFDRQLGFEHETNRAFIAGNLKLVVRHENDDEVELYNIEKDPSELNNLAATMPKRRAELIESWNAWASRVGVPAGRQLAAP